MIIQDENIKIADNEAPEGLTGRENEGFEQCQKELREWKDKFVAVTADFQNFKKRIEKEQSQQVRIARVRMVMPLLEIVDLFERALNEQDAAALEEETRLRLAGFGLIYQELLKMLTSMNIVRMNSYHVFDPHLHEALMQVDSSDHQSGSIVQVLQQGYMMDGEVLRIAKVSVAR